MIKKIRKCSMFFTISTVALMAIFFISGNAISVHAQENQKNGLVHEGTAWNYYVDGKIATDVTTLVKYNGIWWYVHNGKIDFAAKTVVKYGNTWYYVNGGQVHWNDTGLCKYNGFWWYIKNGKIDFSSRTLVKYNGTWWFVENGLINWDIETVVKYNGTWYYVKNGQVDWKSGETLCEYNHFWWYIRNGKIDFNTTTLCPYNGIWWYVRGGHVDFGSHVNSAKVNAEHATASANDRQKWNMMGGTSAYDGTNITVNDGKPATGYRKYYHLNTEKNIYEEDGFTKSKDYKYDQNEYIEINGTEERVSDSYVDMGNYVQHSDVVGDNASNFTLCYYNGTWWVVKNGKALISDKEVLIQSIIYVRYGEAFYYTKGGKVDFTYSEKDLGTNYNFVNGVCPIEKWMGNILL